LGEGKAKMIGKEYPLEGLGFLDDMRVEQWISLLEKKTAVKVKKA
jgi:hypothetical protein